MIARVMQRAALLPREFLAVPIHPARLGNATSPPGNVPVLPIQIVSVGSNASKMNRAGGFVAVAFVSPFRRRGEQESPVMSKLGAWENSHVTGAGKLGGFVINPATSLGIQPSAVRVKRSAHGYPLHPRSPGRVCSELKEEMWDSNVLLSRHVMLTWSV